MHYGHSCLVPVDVTKVPCMYIFADIRIDTEHLIKGIRQVAKAFCAHIFVDIKICTNADIFPMTISDCQLRAAPAVQAPLQQGGKVMLPGINHFAY